MFRRNTGKKCYAAIRTGRDIIEDLETRFTKIRNETAALKSEAEQNLSDIAENKEDKVKFLKDDVDQAIKNASEGVSEFKQTLSEKSDELVKQAKFASYDIKKGAGEVGLGFQKAWNEFRQALETAYGRLK